MALSLSRRSKVRIGRFARLVKSITPALLVRLCGIYLAAIGTFLVVGEIIYQHSARGSGLGFPSQSSHVEFMGIALLGYLMIAWPKLRTRKLLRGLLVAIGVVWAGITVYLKELEYPPM